MATAANVTEFADDAEVEVCTVGTVWVEAGGAINPYSNIQWQTGDYKWDAEARAANHAALANTNTYYAGRAAAADTNIIKARIGYGRAI